MKVQEYSYIYIEVNNYTTLKASKVRKIKKLKSDFKSGNLSICWRDFTSPLKTFQKLLFVIEFP